MENSSSVEAITLARAAFSSAQGNLGLIKFSVEELTPVNPTEDGNSKTWNLICSFYESLGSSTPSKYNVSVNIENKSVSIKKIGGGETERKFSVIEQGTEELTENNEAIPTEPTH